VGIPPFGESFRVDPIVSHVVVQAKPIQLEGFVSDCLDIRACARNATREKQNAKTALSFVSERDDDVPLEGFLRAVYKLVSLSPLTSPKVFVESCNTPAILHAILLAKPKACIFATFRDTETFTLSKKFRVSCSTPPSFDILISPSPSAINSPSDALTLFSKLSDSAIALAKPHLFLDSSSPTDAIAMEERRLLSRQSPVVSILRLTGSDSGEMLDFLLVSKSGNSEGLPITRLVKNPLSRSRINEVFLAKPACLITNKKLFTIAVAMAIDSHATQ